MLKFFKFIFVLLVINFYLITTIEAELLKIGRLVLEKSEREIDAEFLTINGCFGNDSANPLINFEVELLQDLLGTTTLRTEIFNFFGGNYKSFIKTGAIDICDFFKNRKAFPMISMFYDDLLLKGNFPKACPIRKDKYYVKNFTINANMLPSYMPSGKYRIHFLVNHNIDNIKKQIYLSKHFINII